ncbi:hypothetical protein CAEBREN_10678 [Caenorhabditis brenneri]|uniref:CCHC-type domain-containing protein n=1 Tax=Caenorhabditis brenneri TaxID=135651 RepID=G0ND50_CAEBE|nr:hypothetical protein CAEBREN_10678 [Caenorhabditis brenneri]
MPMRLSTENLKLRGDPKDACAERLRHAVLVDLKKIIEDADVTTDALKTEIREASGAAERAAAEANTCNLHIQAFRQDIAELLDRVTGILGDIAQGDPVTQAAGDIHALARAFRLPRRAHGNFQSNSVSSASTYGGAGVMAQDEVVEEVLSTGGNGNGAGGSSSSGYDEGDKDNIPSNSGVGSSKVSDGSSSPVGSEDSSPSGKKDEINVGVSDGNIRQNVGSSGSQKIVTAHVGSGSPSKVDHGGDSIVSSQSLTKVHLTSTGFEDPSSGVGRGQQEERDHLSGEIKALHEELREIEAEEQQSVQQHKKDNSQVSVPVDAGDTYLRDIDSIPQVFSLSFKVGPMTPFTGSSSGPRFTDWIRGFKDRLAASQVDETSTTACSMLLANLGDQARDRAEEITQTFPNITVEELIKKLTDCFEHKAYRAQAMDQLHTLKQTPSETVESFYGRVTKMVKMAYGNCSDTSAKEALKHRFMNGLHTSMALSLMGRQYDSPQQIYELALTMEPLWKNKESISTEEVKQAVVCSIQREFQMERAGNNKSMITCYYCDKQGHVQSECYKKYGRDAVLARKKEQRNSKPQNPVTNHKINRPHVNTAQEGSSVEERLQQALAQIEALKVQNNKLMANRFDNTGNYNYQAQVIEFRASAPEETPVVQQVAHQSQFLTVQVPIKINGFMFAALVDTGSNITVAGSHVCNYLGIQNLSQDVIGNAFGLGNNCVAMAGTAELEFQVGSQSFKHRVYFTVGRCTPESHQSYEFILGNDLLRKMPPLTCDFTEYRVWFGNESLPMGQKKSNTIA